MGDVDQIVIEEEGKIEGLNLEDHTFLAPFFQFDLCSSLAIMRSSLHWVGVRLFCQANS